MLIKLNQGKIDFADFSVKAVIPEAIYESNKFTLNSYPKIGDKYICYDFSQADALISLLNTEGISYELDELEWDALIVERVNDMTFDNMEDASRHLVLLEGDLFGLEKENLEFKVAVPPIYNGKVLFYTKMADSNGKLIKSSLVESDYDGVEYYKSFAFGTPGTYIIGVETSYGSYELEVLVKASIEIARDAKIKELNTACDKTIEGGFQSAVVLASTGKAHFYTTDREDQLNFMGKLTQMLANPGKATLLFKASDTEEYEEHTTDEFKLVCNEVVSHIENNLYKCKNLKKQAKEAQTVDEIKAIVW